MKLGDCFAIKKMKNVKDLNKSDEIRLIFPLFEITILH